MSDSIDFKKEIEKLKASKVELESQLESLKKSSSKNCFRQITKC
ncbi:MULTISPECIES: hypothetical protein [Borreliella]|uniref:Uncharacterized protein n=1 Tax=Borrelia garinii subsp. bavariensis (strain ATCC BAA-2496 / DSM 23469 / PBi) TaxID=290434 RepID=A0A7I6GV68_BORGP|nr:MULTISPECIES: hypothetical protein [Borreliella]AAT93794.1 hypothetical protein BGA35 [Borreliella bavariensis PBi]WLN24534.1 hypothetical protein IDK87_04500 [Borreliella bavariensis]